MLSLRRLLVAASQGLRQRLAAGAACRPARSPGTMLANFPRCTTSPSGPRVALIWHSPPNTRRASNSRSSTSYCSTPFMMGSTAVSGPTAGRIASMALARS